VQVPVDAAARRLAAAHHVDYVVCDVSDGRRQNARVRKPGAGLGYGCARAARRVAVATAAPSEQVPNPIPLSPRHRRVTRVGCGLLGGGIESVDLVQERCDNDNIRRAARRTRNRCAVDVERLGVDGAVAGSASVARRAAGGRGWARRGARVGLRWREKLKLLSHGSATDVCGREAGFRRISSSALAVVLGRPDAEVAGRAGIVLRQCARGRQEREKARRYRGGGGRI
jgi:hypothetical protein